MNHLIKPLAVAIVAAFAAGAAPSVVAQGKDLKIALIAGKTGPLEELSGKLNA